MLPLTHSDYFTTSGHGDNWKVNLKSCTQTPESFHNECIRAAKILYESASSSGVAPSKEQIKNLAIAAGYELSPAQMQAFGIAAQEPSARLD